MWQQFDLPIFLPWLARNKKKTRAMAFASPAFTEAAGAAGAA